MCKFPLDNNMANHASIIEMASIRSVCIPGSPDVTSQIQFTVDCLSHTPYVLKYTTTSKY